MQTSHSQLDPLPSNLPFELISETLGRGAYAFVRKARENAGGPVFAVKFIHKGFAAQYGQITKKELDMEVSLHQYISGHENVIRFFRSEESPVWRWIAMEFAEGGDLFDKIEADVGVQEDIAHFYFHQLIAGVSFLHSKGVAHRDIKPENILLDSDGNLKLADFGYASLFSLRGKVRMSTRLVGSPPYVAPEVSTQVGYQGDQVDIWSSGVVLYVLLTGNTPWDEPTESSPEFYDYRKYKGILTYEPWDRISPDALSLIRGMMTIDKSSRFTFDQITQHPWFTKNNPIMSADGRCGDGVGLATRLIEGLHVDFSSQVEVEATPEDEDEEMASASESEMDEAVSATPTSSSVKRDSETKEWDNDVHMATQMSQPSQYLRNRAALSQDYHDDVYDTVVEDPSMSQFTAEPSVPMTLTQIARRFQDICPSTLTRFYTTYTFSQFLPLLNKALQRLKIPAKNGRQLPAYYDHPNHTEWIKIKMRDGRKQPLNGTIGIERVAGNELSSQDVRGLLCVSFVKSKGDPLEWRRFFKKISIMCQNALYKPGY